MKISLVIPVFNDTDALEELLSRLHLVFCKMGHEVQVIIVDDGSEVKEWCLLKKRVDEFSVSAASQYFNVTLIRLKGNLGQSLATLVGLIYADGKYLVTMDSDLQHAPEDIPELIKNLCNNSLQLIYARIGRGHGAFRRLAGGIRRRLAAPIGTPLSYASSFRVIDGQFFNRLIRPDADYVFSLDEALSWRATLTSFIDVPHYTRKYNGSTYSLAALFSFALRSAWHSRHLPRALTILGAGLFMTGFYLAYSSAKSPTVWEAFSFSAATISLILALFARLSWRRPVVEVTAQIREIIEWPEVPRR